MCCIDRQPKKTRKVDAVLDALSDAVRREIVRYFENCNSEPTATLGELVAHVERKIPDSDDAEVTALLVHKHIPKLEENGWLEFERRSETVRYHGHDSAERLLRQVADLFA